MKTATFYQSSPLGWLALHETNGKLTRIAFVEEPSDGQVGSEMLRSVAAQLAQYFAGTRRKFDVPLAAFGTTFQQRVWRALQTVGFGESTSYGAIATEIGQPTAARAVGAANGKNPWPIIVPCHRIIGSNGALTGYAFGTQRKAWLLDFERSR